MQPIVNGLEDEFVGQLAFEQRDANTEVGQASIRAYGLRGHPSYAIVTPEGEALWQFMGSLSADTLRQQISRYGGQ